MDKFTVPEWLNDLVIVGARLLKLSGWDIRIKIVASPGGDPGNMAVVAHSPNTWSSTIYFRHDIEDNYDWWQAAFHELVHLKLAHLQQLVQKNFIGHLPYEAQELARAIWKDQHEQTVDALATSYAEMYRDYIRE